jgi:hypothetical protein
MDFISAKEGSPNYGDTSYTVQYFDKDGNMVIRSGGTKAWRNNNPGNMVYHPRGFAPRHGAIGSADGMAVFPDEQTGSNRVRPHTSNLTGSGLTLPI